MICNANCQNEATLYALDPIPGGWGGYYCADCSPRGWITYAETDNTYNGAIERKG